jgi:hypothetical protein
VLGVSTNPITKPKDLIVSLYAFISLPSTSKNARLNAFVAL